ncbi:MAG: pyridoxamine 5'-phosphate oxidase family protein [Synergistaceae bacterium]|jgi:uncharacterized pyridoxamine 5'-phosphate oxidase family protein|nr:pyridoxamine 5'-phosphate oxidase family protein [Synergistaceae bacterium]
MQQVVDLIHEAGVFHIATIDGDRPRVRPFGLIMLFEDKLYFTTANRKSFYRQLQKNPNVEISAMIDEDRWLRLEGKAVFDGNPAAKKQAFEIYPDFRQIYQTPENPVFEVFYLAEPSATLYSMTEDAKKIL